MRSNRWTILMQNQVVAIVLALLVAVPALFAVPNVQRIHQLTVYGLLGVCLLVAWLFRAQERISLQKVRTMALSGPNLPLLLYIGWSVLCTVTSSEPLLSRAALLQLLVGVLVYGMIVYQFRNKGQVQTLLSCLLGLAVIVVLAAFAFDRNLTQLAGPLHDRQLFGAFLALMLPVIVGVAAGTKKQTWKLGAQIAAVVVAVALLLTGCRSAWIGTACAMLTFGSLSVLFAVKWQGFKQRKHQLIVAPALAVVALAGFLVLNPGAGSQVTQRFGTFQNAGGDASVQDRTGTLWAVAGKMIAARPLTGSGLGSYPLAQVPFNPESRHASVIRQMGPSLSESPHNTYLQIAAETGIPGLAFYLGIFGMVFFYGIRALRKMEGGLRQYVLIGSLSAVAGMGMDGIANPGYMFPEVSTFFWVVIGIAMCAAGLGQEVREESTETVSVPALGMPTFVLRGLRTAAIGCCALWAGVMVLGLGNTGFASAAGGGGGKGINLPLYCDLLDRIAIDFLNNGEQPTFGALVGGDTAGAVELFNAARFKVYAIDDDQFISPPFPIGTGSPRNMGGVADVTSERRAIRVTPRRPGYSVRWVPSPLGGQEIWITPINPKVAGTTRPFTFTYRCPGNPQADTFALTVNPILFFGPPGTTPISNLPTLPIDRDPDTGGPIY